jgi:hypothetical protein
MSAAIKLAGTYIVGLSALVIAASVTIAVIKKPIDQRGDLDRIRRLAQAGSMYMETYATPPWKTTQLVDQGWLRADDLAMAADPYDEGFYESFLNGSGRQGSGARQTHFDLSAINAYGSLLDRLMVRENAGWCATFTEWETKGYLPLPMTYVRLKLDGSVMNLQTPYTVKFTPGKETSIAYVDLYGDKP